MFNVFQKQLFPEMKDYCCSKSQLKVPRAVILVLTVYIIKQDKLHLYPVFGQFMNYTSPLSREKHNF